MCAMIREEQGRADEEGAARNGRIQGDGEEGWAKLYGQIGRGACRGGRNFDRRI